jgi:hypothetical protein
MRVFQSRRVEHWVAALPSHAFLNPASDDAAEPGAEFVRFAQEPEVFPGGHERFLGHVFAPAHAPGGAIRHGADQGLITSNDAAEGVPASVKTFGN